MAFQDDLAQFINSGYPDRTLKDPSKKTPAWIFQHAKADVTEFWRCRPHWKLWCFDDHVAENIRYATGTQDTQQYRRMGGHEGGGLTADSLEVTNRDTGSRGRSGGANDPLGLDSIINAQPLPILPVKLEGLKALIKQRYETTITALGEKADKQAREHEAEVRMWMGEEGEQWRALGATPPPDMPDPMPANEPELRTYLSNWQVKAAADLELKILISDSESDLEQQMDDVADDILAHGYGGLFDHYQPGKRTISKRILPGTGLFLPSSTKDYRDQNCGGVFDTLSYGALLAEIADDKHTCNHEGKPWTPDDRAALKQLAARSLPDNLSNVDPALGYRESTGAIRVVRWFFRTDNRRTWKSYEDEAGNKRNRPQGPAYELGEEDKDSTLAEATVNCLYEATLVCGTNLAYNCRKVLDQGRDLHNPLKARLPFSLFSAGITNGEPTSIVRRAKGIVDEMERAWRGYMADIRTYMPEGYNITMKALTNMVQVMKIEGDNPEMEAYRYILQTGGSFADLYDVDSNQQVGAPVTKNAGGIPASAALHLNALFQQLQLLESVTGANSVVSAATPSGDASGKGVNQIALQGASNVMGFARDGLKRIYENHARNLAGRIWATDAEIPVTGSVPGPDGAPRQVGPRKDFHEYGFHMRVELGPTDEEWKELYARAAAASQAGQITVADETMITWLRNLKTAQQYLVMAVGRKARQDEAKAMGLQKQNGDVQTQTAQAAAQAQQETDAKKHELTMQEMQFSRETAWGTVDRQTAAQRDIAGLNSETKREISLQEQMGASDREQAATQAANQHDHESAMRDALLAPEPVAP